MPGLDGFPPKTVVIQNRVNGIISIIVIQEATCAFLKMAVTSSWPEPRRRPTVIDADPVFSPIRNKRSSRGPRAGPLERGTSWKKKSRKNPRNAIMCLYPTILDPRQEKEKKCEPLAEELGAAKRSRKSPRLSSV